MMEFKALVSQSASVQNVLPTGADPCATSSSSTTLIGPKPQNEGLTDSLKSNADLSEGLPQQPGQAKSSDEMNEGSNSSIGGNEDEDDGSEESDSSSGDEDEEEPVPNPSTDIRADLQEVLGSSMEFTGSFACAQSYPEAPNPCLKIEGIGPLGLPLSEREAKILISVCEQAPFGKGERTVVDKNVRDTWQLSSKKIRFDNPKWQHFLSTNIVPDLCVKLGVNAAAAAPRCELYKLLVYEPGSHFLPHQDTEKVDGMFATIIIVLPSRFSGAELHLSHSGSTKIFDLAQNSGVTTSAMAWYADVFHEVKPLQTGYRLALSYNLIHTGNLLRPSLPEMHSSIETLRRVLLSWKHSALDEAPAKIAYLLDHQYSQANLDADSLKGKDAHIMSHLLPLAKKHHFRIYLANVELHVVGSAEGGGYQGHRQRCYYDDYSDEDDDNVTMGEVQEKTLTIENIVNLDGDLADFKLDLDEETEMIPESLEDGEPDDEEYEGYQGNYAGSLEYWYRRTVLIIWPKKRDLEVTAGDIVGYAVDIFSRSNSTSPTKKELKLVEYLLEYCQTLSRNDPKLSLAVKSLCMTAGRWKDARLWIRSAKACGADHRIEILGIGEFTSALKVFGFEAIHDFLSDVLKNGLSNARRLELVERIAQTSSTQPIREWCAEQTDKIMFSLTTPHKEDATFLVHASRAKGVEFVRERLIPQMKDASMQFWMAFMTTLHTEKDTILPSSDVVMAFVSELLVEKLNKADVFATKKVKVPAYQYPYGAQATPSHERAMGLVRVCLATGNIENCSILFNKMASSTATADIQRSRTVHVYLPMITQLDQVLRTTGIVVGASPFSIFFRTAAVAIVENLVGNHAFGPSQMPAFWIAVKWGGGLALLRQHLIPRLQGLPQHVTKDFALAAFRERASIPISQSSTDSNESLIKDLVSAAIDRADLASVAVGYGSRTSHSVDVALDMIKLCYSTQNPNLCTRVIQALVKPRGNMSQRITHILLPLIPVLRQYLRTQGIALTVEPYPRFLVAIFKAFAINVLGPKPADRTTGRKELLTFGCGCMDCNTVKSFFAGSHKQTVIRRAQTYRTHLERGLEKIRNFGVSWTTVRHGSPHGLQITKSDSMTALGAWDERRKEGLAALATIGKEAEQRQVLGADYNVVVQALQGQMSIGGDPLSGLASLSNEVAQAQVPRRPLNNTQVLSTAGSSGSKRALPSDSSSAQPVAKKPRPKGTLQEPFAVIDLTSP